jgi:hypothetical protein
VASTGFNDHLVPLTIFEGTELKAGKTTTTITGAPGVTTTMIDKINTPILLRPP